MTINKDPASQPLELRTPWKSSPDGKAEAITPQSDHSRTSSDTDHVATKTSPARSSPPRAVVKSELTSTADANERSVVVIVPEAPPQVKRGSTPVHRRLPSIVSAMSCSMCSATGVNSLWRRDRAGKPICGKCCEQLRRRMNPRYAVTSRGEMLSHPSAREMPIRRQTPSPNGRPAPYPTRSPLPNGRPLASPYQPGTNGLMPTPSNARPNGGNPYLEHGQQYNIGRQESRHRLALPPLSSIERVADHYRRDPAYHIKEPISLPAAPSAFRPKHLPPQHTTGERRPSIHGDRLQERLVGVSEADIQQKRALLVEGRKWIFAMLDETTAMLRQLDEASLKAGAAD